MWRPAPDVVEDARTLDNDRVPGQETRDSTDKSSTKTLPGNRVTASDHQHDVRLCATCAEFAVWDPSLRHQLELRAWLAGRRRICDLWERVA